jgi:hypothetical protein
VLTTTLPHAAWAQLGYRVQPILRAGDRVGDRVIRAPSGRFGVLRLNEDGRFAVAAGDAAGGEMLLEYGEGTVTPIVLAGGAAPDGAWPARPVLGGPGLLNASGDLLFSVGRDPNSEFVDATYLWDARARQVKVIARAGMQSTVGQSLIHGGGFISTLNDRGEVGLVASVRNATGLEKSGVFLVTDGGQIRPVALPDQVLPDGKRLIAADFPVVNDSGAVAFRGIREGDGESPGAYLWENGQVRPVAQVRQELPNFGRVRHCFGALVNSRNRNILLQLGRPGVNEAYVILRDGEFRTVAALGQEMPGGGKLTRIHADSFSYASASGEHAFLAELADRTTAAYRIDADGRLSLLLKSGEKTDQGTITRIRSESPGDGSYGVGINGKGQLVLTLQLDGGPDTLVLLTPNPPTDPR